MPLLALNKPFGTICQFSPHEKHPSLGEWVTTPGVYPAGRLDTDSEGLLLLTDDGALKVLVISGCAPAKYHATTAPQSWPTT